MARLRILPLLTLLAVAVSVPATASAQQMGADYLASDNVEFVRAIKSPIGLTTGARIIGDRMFVTSSKDLEIFDISKPDDPQRLGLLTANVQFENEEVPSNGKLLGISSDLLNSSPTCLTAPLGGLPGFGGCLRLYDVRDPAGVKELPAVPGAGDHTSTCVLDCSYFYGSEGTITDARAALDGGQSRIIGNWKTALREQGFSFTPPGARSDVSCHNLNEVRPGVLMTSCNPITLISVNAEDGGSILKPKVLASGGTPKEAARFIHSAHWPNQGKDRFATVGGETNFQPQCGATNGAFMTFDATIPGKFSLIDEIRPINGSYLDSNPPAQVLGCSVHWFEEHATFRDGGLVALAEYENGTRFLQVQPDGKLKEQGYFIPLGGSTSAPHWAPNSDILYAIDYERGIDVLRYKGSHYVPTPTSTSSTTTSPAAPGSVPPAGGGTVQDEPGRVAGTEGRQPGPPASSSSPAGGKPGSSGRNESVCATTAGFRRVAALPRKRGGKAGSGLALTFSRRVRKRVNVDIFQVSSGKKVVTERLVKRFRNKRKSFAWNGRGVRRKLTDGVYFARFTMVLGKNRRDVRRVTLDRRQGKFRPRPAFYQRDSCGALESFKLQRPVFGGKRRAPLRIAYRVTSGADKVIVQVRQRGRVRRTFRATGGEAGRTYRLSLPARGLRRGDVKVTVTVQRANARVHSSLTARRL